ncbi:hypothetical protein Leryth_026679 [Lithospermum erythrorhizon]|nr:hypothetical protein Leryth_026679 [Lithospermum erythrorhizon]
MDWVRGKRIGQGSFGTVNLAIPTNQTCSKMTAVKSCGVVHSASLMNEKSILDELKGCNEIISSFGDCFTIENGEKLYNVLLEYASGGSLANKLKNSDDHHFQEFDVKRYTKGVLRGLQFIHMNGYVHCDIKLQNILLDQNGDIKIADFGLAKKSVLNNKNNLGCELRGTPMYMSPETVIGGEQECPADIWALGCVVAEMVTGASAWPCSDVAGLMMKIGGGEEVPEMPRELSDEGKDFLEKCFAKDPKKRWTAEMLLNHSFVYDTLDIDFIENSVSHWLIKNSSDLSLTSPRCPFDFSDWVTQHSSITYSIMSTSVAEDFDFIWCSGGGPSTSVAERLAGLLLDQISPPDWSVEDHWVTVR